MFRSEGVHRSDRHNRIVAGYLALVAGFINSTGFLVIGTFTSHVTGNVGRFADDVALGQGAAALLAASMVAAFFTGAFVASMAIESNLVARRPWVYAGLHFGEAALLITFVVLTTAAGTDAHGARVRDAYALLLCVAMGLQNSLVTRLSGAVVRTTHLTGVVTDLGIEAARWFRYWRAVVGETVDLRLTAGSLPPTRPSAPKLILLLTIVTAFVLGSASGALASLELGARALLVPIALLVVAGSAAALSGLEVPSDAERR